jgi:type I restriction enzyme R subunit
VGICKEDALAGEVKEHNGLGYVMGQPNDFNKQYAVDEKFLFQFLELTQKTALMPLDNTTQMIGRLNY